MGKKITELINYWNNLKNNINNNLNNNLNNRFTNDSYNTINNLKTNSILSNINSPQLSNISFSEFSNYSEQSIVLTPVSNKSIQVIDYITTQQYNNYYDIDSERSTSNKLNDSEYNVQSLEDNFSDFSININNDTNNTNNNEINNTIVQYYNILENVILFTLSYLYILFINIISTQFIINNNNSIYTYTNWIYISISYGLIFIIINNISNICIQYLQFNPILTILLVLFNNIHKNKIYKNINIIIYQIISSLLANITIYGIYYNEISKITDINIIGKIYSTQKNINRSILSSSFLLLILSIIYTISYIYILRLYNSRIIKSLLLSISYIILFILFGYDIGYSINPIHTLISNIFILIVYNNKFNNIFTINTYWGIISIFIPILGILIGNLIYKYIIKKKIEVEI